MDIFELRGPKGERLLFVAVATGELSNDHLAYYELLYDDSVSPARLLDRRQWYFDVAGFEGLEFAFLATRLSALFLIVIMPIIGGVLAYKRLKGLSKAARLARGHCPACGYDLVRDVTRGCPECGWGVVGASAR